MKTFWLIFLVVNVAAVLALYRPFRSRPGGDSDTQILTAGLEVAGTVVLVVLDVVAIVIRLLIRFL